MDSIPERMGTRISIDPELETKITNRLLDKSPATARELSKELERRESEVLGVLNSMQRVGFVGLRPGGKWAVKKK